jgi:hypothetical protein
VILAPEVYHIRDAIHDARAQANQPARNCTFRRAFYAAAPLRTPDDFNLGAPCVVDRAPLELAAAEAQMLTKLARWSWTRWKCDWRQARTVRFIFVRLVRAAIILHLMFSGEAHHSLVGED